MDVQRYGPNECGSTGMEHDPSGDYVTFEDYEDILDEWKDTNNKYNELVDKIANLWREC